MLLSVQTEKDEPAVCECEELTQFVYDEELTKSIVNRWKFNVKNEWIRIQLKFAKFYTCKACWLPSSALIQICDECDGKFIGHKANEICEDCERLWS